MPVSLIPNHLFESYQDITPQWLSGQGVELLLSDLDFTLAPKSVRQPDEALRTWIASLQEAGIRLMIVSNNRSGRRVTEFCAQLGAEFRHPPAGAVVGDDHQPDPRLLQRRDPRPQRLVRLADALGSQREVQITEQQLHPLSGKPLGRDILIGFKQMVWDQRNGHKRLLVCIGCF